MTTIIHAKERDFKFEHCDFTMDTKTRLIKVYRQGDSSKIIAVYNFDQIYGASQTL